jgi:hypothetical protein
MKRAEKQVRHWTQIAKEKIIASLIKNTPRRIYNSYMITNVLRRES